LREDQVVAGGCLDDTFNAIAPAAFLDLLYETMFLQLAKMVVDLLSWQSQFAGDAGGRIRRPQPFEDLQSQRIQHGQSAPAIVYQLNMSGVGSHLVGSLIRPTNNFVKKYFLFGGRLLYFGWRVANEVAGATWRRYHPP